MATSCDGAQETIRAHGSSKCSIHRGYEIMFVCENCDELVCADCVIKQHKGHALEGLSNSIPGAKQKLQDFISKVEGIEIPRIQAKLKKVNGDLTKNRKQFKKQVSQIKIRNEILKKELDKIADTMVKTCQGMENQNSETLLNHQMELKIQLDNLSSKIQEVNATLQSGNEILVYDTSHMIPSEFEDLPTPSWSTAEFSQSKLALQELEHLLGQLNITDHNRLVLSVNKPVNWRVMLEFTPYEGHNVSSIHTAGDEAWISTYSKTMLSVNQKGQVQQTLHMDVWVTDFCKSPQTSNIWFCSDDDNSVREVKDSRDQVKFTADTVPLCICVTRDDHIVIGSDCQIVKYTQTGQKICTTSGETPPIVRYPHHMSECPLTRHVAVVDWEFGIHRGTDKPFVSILNDQLQLLRTYRGEVSGQQPPPSQFNPWDVCYTDTGELVITDYDNNTVVLVTGTGEYLQTLYTDSESQPIAVSVHSGVLWVSFDKGKVRILKEI